MRYGITMFADRRQHRRRRAGARGRGPGLRLAVAARAHPHPHQPQDAAGRRARTSCPRSTSAASTRSWRWAPRRRPPRTLRLGTGILLAAQREPIVTAKAVATLDHLSGGRAALGVGFGWNEDEIEHHGVTMASRRAVARETILAMQALWADDEASFEGEHVRFSPSWSWPKPVQRGADGRPRVPVLLGGAPGPKLFAHIAEYGDGWIPIGGAGLTEAIPRFRDAVAEAGRDPLRHGDRAVRVDPRPPASSTTSSASASPSASSASRARPRTRCSPSSTSRPRSSPPAAERSYRRRRGRAAVAGDPGAARGDGGRRARVTAARRTSTRSTRTAVLRVHHHEAAGAQRRIGELYASLDRAAVPVRAARGARGARRRRGELVDRAAPASAVRSTA